MFIASQRFNVTRLHLESASIEEFEAEVLQRLTPCVDSDPDRLAAALAECTQS